MFNVVNTLMDYGGWQILVVTPPASSGGKEREITGVSCMLHLRRGHISC